MMCAAKTLAGHSAGAIMPHEVLDRMNTLESQVQSMQTLLSRYENRFRDQKLFCKYVAEYLLHKFGFNIWLRMEMVKAAGDQNDSDGEDLLPREMPSVFKMAVNKQSFERHAKGAQASASDGAAAAGGGISSGAGKGGGGNEVNPGSASNKSGGVNGSTSSAHHVSKTGGPGTGTRNNSNILQTALSSTATSTNSSSSTSRSPPTTVEKPVHARTILPKPTSCGDSSNFQSIPCGTSSSNEMEVTAVTVPGTSGTSFRYKRPANTMPTEAEQQPYKFFVVSSASNAGAVKNTYPPQKRTGTAAVSPPLNKRQEVGNNNSMTLANTQTNKAVEDDTNTDPYPNNGSPLSTEIRVFGNVVELPEINISGMSKETEEVDPLDCKDFGGLPQLEDNSAFALSRGGTSNKKNTVEIVHDYSDPSIEIKYENELEENDFLPNLQSMEASATSGLPKQESRNNLSKDGTLHIIAPPPVEERAVVRFRRSSPFDISWLYQMKQYQPTLMPYSMFIKRDELRQWFEYIPNAQPEESRFRCRLCYRYLQTYGIPRSYWGPVESEQGQLKKSEYDNRNCINAHAKKKSHLEVMRKLQMEGNPEVGFVDKFDKSMKRQLIESLERNYNS